MKALYLRRDCGHARELMGVLVHGATRRAHALAARVLVGRSRSCIVRLDGALVSGEHATLAWAGCWSVRDLGSRNGTWVDDRKLASGERTSIQRGTRIGFGDPGDVWLLEDDAPPGAMAVPLDGGEAVVSAGDVLLLPADDAPELAVQRGPDGWVVEQGFDASPVADQHTLVAGGKVYRLYLPDVLEATVASTEPIPNVAGLTLRLGVSRDQEFVKTEVFDGQAWRVLDARAYHYMLVVLGRGRLEDQNASAAECGWIHLEDLAERLATDPRTLDVHIMRLRRQFGELGIERAADVIERRRGTRQVRLGVQAVEIYDL